jgi:hypothetical protein
MESSVVEHSWWEVKEMQFRAQEDEQGEGVLMGVVAPLVFHGQPGYGVKPQWV